MNVPANGHDPEDHDGSKWNTIRYAIGRWDTTVRLLAVLAVLLGPAYLAYLIFWLTRR